MSKILKTFSLTFAIFFTVSFVGIRVKAAGTATVVAGTAVAAALSFLLSEYIVKDVSNDINFSFSSVNNYSEYEFTESDVQETNSAINGFLDIAFGDILISLDSSRYELRSCLEKAAQAALDDSAYKSGDKSAILAYEVLKSAANSSFAVNKNGEVIIDSGSFTQFYNDCLSGFLSGVSDTAVSVGVSNGIRQIVGSLSKFKLFPELSEKYGIRQIVASSYSYMFFSKELSLPSNYVHYLVLVHNNSVVDSVISLPHEPFPYYFDISTSQYWLKFEQSYSYFFISAHIQDGFSHVEEIEGFRDLRTGSKNMTVTFDGFYAFDFPNIESAELFLSDIVVDTTYDPSKDDSADVVIDVNPSSVEKAIESQKDKLGVDEVDITVNPGAVREDDDSVAYNPSISIAGTDIKDIAKDDSKAEEDEKKEDSFREEEFIKGLSSASWGSSFPLYDQCKLIITNIFNYDDVVDPPSFKFYWDSNGDGNNEIYDVLDLSFLETELTNDNMQDKGWFATPIKAIDLLRYIIAAVIYGLFAMRLIKRLPTFYGSGPFTGL